MPISPLGRRGELFPFIFSCHQESAVAGILQDLTPRCCRQLQDVGSRISSWSFPLNIPELLLFQHLFAVLRSAHSLPLHYSLIRAHLGPPLAFTIIMRRILPSSSRWSQTGSWQFHLSIKWRYPHQPSKSIPLKMDDGYTYKHTHCRRNLTRVLHGSPGAFLPPNQATPALPLQGPIFPFPQPHHTVCPNTLW